MALDELQGIIKKLQDVIETHHNYLSRHETRTRQVLIDPLLRELGWDVSDPEAVQLEYAVKLEYRAGKKWADYTLMFKDESMSDDEPKPVAVIEAKPLESNLEDDKMMQVLNYANRDGIDYMIVTDGDKWEMYEVFKRGALEERLLMKFCLSQQPAHHSALQALGMWKPNLASDGGPSKATEPVFISPEPTLDRPSSQSNEQPEPQLPDDSPPDFDQWYSLTSERRYPPYTIPMQLKIIGTDIDRRVNAWKDVIHEVVAWLIDTEKLTDNHFPIEIKENIFISREAVNRDGTPFKDPQQLPKGLILDRRRGRPWDQWERLRELLDQLQVDTNTIRVSHKPDIWVKRE